MKVRKYIQKFVSSHIITGGSPVTQFRGLQKFGKPCSKTHHQLCKENRQEGNFLTYMFQRERERESRPACKLGSVLHVLNKPGSRNMPEGLKGYIHIHITVHSGSFKENPHCALKSSILLCRDIFHNDPQHQNNFQGFILVSGHIVKIPLAEPQPDV